jgi:hypothetical protein
VVLYRLEHADPERDAADPYKGATVVCLAGRIGAACTRGSGCKAGVEATHGYAGVPFPSDDIGSAAEWRLQEVVEKYAHRYNKEFGTAYALSVRQLTRREDLMRTSWVVAVGCAMALACSSDDTGPGDAPPDCSGPVTIAVSSGLTPSFSWTPACRLFFVNVELGGSDQWSIISDGTNAIAPPVQYGVVPAGADQSSPAVTPLQAGQTYDVNLFYWTGPGAQDGTFIGSQDFVP